MNKPSNSPSVHFGASPTFYGSSANSGTTGTYLPYGTPSIQTFFQPTSQTSNKVSSQHHHSSSQNTPTNQNFLALTSTPRTNQSLSGSVLQASSKFQNATSSSTSTSASPGTIFASKKQNKGSLTSNVDSTGGSTAAQRALSPSYEEDSTVRDYLSILFHFFIHHSSILSHLSDLISKSIEIFNDKNVHFKCHLHYNLI